MQNKKIFILLGGCFAFAVFLYFGIASAKVEIGNDFSNAYTSYVKSLPNDTSFSNLAEEVYPYYLNPISSFDLSLAKLAKQNFKKGDSINISGTLKFSFQGKNILSKLQKDCLMKINNPNVCRVDSNYSVSEASKLGVFVQIWRKDLDSEKSAKGDYLIDEFYLAKNITLKDGQEGNFNYKWKIPEEINDGQYYFSYYVNSDQSFDLSGTPLTTFNAAKTQDFSIEKDNQNQRGVEIDKNSLTVNGKEYSYRNLAPVVEGGQDISVEGKVTNYDSNTKQTKIKYTLSKWGQEDPGDVISQKEDDLSLPGNSDTPIKFSFNPGDSNSLYNLNISLVSPSSSSSSDIRVVIKNNHRGIFRFLGFLNKDNGDVVPYFCIRDAQWEGGLNGRVNLSVSDGRGVNLLAWSGQGVINSGNDRCFIPKGQEISGGKGCITVKGEILNDKDVPTDIKEATFGCAVDSVSNFEYKNADSKPGTVSKVMGRAGNNLGVAVLLILIFSLLVLVLFIINNKKNKQKNDK